MDALLPQLRTSRPWRSRSCAIGSLAIFAAEAERITSVQIIDRLLAEIQPEHP